MTMSFPTSGQRVSAIGVSGGNSGANQNANNSIRRSRPLSLANPMASPSGSFDAGNGGPRTGGSTSGNSSSRKHEEELINAYEAEEERIINVLSRKLEQVCSSVHHVVSGSSTRPPLSGLYSLSMAYYILQRWKILSDTIFTQSSSAKTKSIWRTPSRQSLRTM